MFGKIWDAILAEDTIIGSIDHESLTGVINMGQVAAPDDMPFLGFDLQIAIMEFVN